MDQSKSDNVPLPKRNFTTEFWVGVFTIFGVLCAGWLSVGLGGVKIFTGNQYSIFAEFDNISGLKMGASVEIAGVSIGEVTGIKLEKDKAIVTLTIDKVNKIHSDDVASIRTKGIIGDRYIKLTPGASDIIIGEGGIMTDTESVIDIEDIIGKIVHSLTGDKDEEKKEEKTT